MSCPITHCINCSTCHFRVSLPKISIKTLYEYVNLIIACRANSSITIMCERSGIRTAMHDKILSEAGIERTDATFTFWLSQYVETLVERQETMNELLRVEHARS